MPRKERTSACLPLNTVFAVEHGEEPGVSHHVGRELDNELLTDLLALPWYS